MPKFQHKNVPVCIGIKSVLEPMIKHFDSVHPDELLLSSGFTLSVEIFWDKTMSNNNITITTLDSI